VRLRLASIVFVFGAMLFWTLLPTYSAVAAPLPPASGGLDRLALDFVGKVGPALEGRRVPTIRIGFQLRQPPGVFSTGQQQLARVLSGLVVTRLRGLKFRQLKVLPTHLDDQTALTRGLRGRCALTLLAQVVVTGGRLHLRARLYDTDQTLWGRLKKRRARLLTHLAVSRRVDNAVRSYLGSPAGKRTLTCTGKWRLLGKQAYWGVALGDVDGDARTELILLRADAVEIRRWNKVYNRFDQVATVPFSGPLASVRPRFIMGSVIVGDLDGDRKADILARISERRTAVQISYKRGRFSIQRRFGGYPMAMATMGGKTTLAIGYPLTGRAEYSGRGLGWKPRVRVRMLMPRVFHNFKLAPFGPLRPKSGYVYGVVDSASKLTLRRLPGGQLQQRLNGVGRAFALGDLDGDGRPEVVTTTVRSFGSSDAISVRRLGKGARLCRVAGFEGSVTAIAVGNVYLDGSAHVASVVWNARRRRSYLLVTR